MALDAMGHLMKSIGLDAQKVSEGIQMAQTTIPQILASFQQMQATLDVIGQNQVQMASAVMTMAKQLNDTYAALQRDAAVTLTLTRILCKEMGVLDKDGERSNDNDGNPGLSRAN